MRAQVSTVLAAADRAGRPFFVNANLTDPHRPFRRVPDPGRDGPHPHILHLPAFLDDLPAVRAELRSYFSSVARLAGGVYLNCGSAVVLPEVFLKAVALVRNQGIALDNLTTVNIDFLRMYRPQTNVVTRPVAGTTGTGISLVGHHEVLIPLIAAAVIQADERGE